MGAWPTMALKLPDILGRPVSRVSVPASSAPAVGSATAHAAEHQHVVGEAVAQE
jgi:2-oxoglutarate dehydrogenase E1 component